MSFGDFFANDELDPLYQRIAAAIRTNSNPDAWHLWEDLTDPDR